MLGNLGFEGDKIRGQSLAGGQSDNIVHAGQGRVRKARIGGRDPAGKGLGQGLSCRAGNRLIIAVARYEQKGRDKPVKGIMAHKQLNPWPVGQVQYAKRRGGQVGQRDLEQLIARIGFQNAA